MRPLLRSGRDGLIMTLAALTIALAATCALFEAFGERFNFHLTSDDFDAIEFGSD